MKNYHPIDVRYKGPSTSYRGSAHGKTPARPIAKSNAPDRPTPKPARAQSNPTPWGPKTAPTRPTPPQPPRARPHPSASPLKAAGSAVRGVRRVFRTIKYVYFAIIALVFFVVLLGSPSGGINAVEVPMKTISAKP